MMKEKLLTVLGTLERYFELLDVEIGNLVSLCSRTSTEFLHVINTIMVL